MHESINIGLIQTSLNDKLAWDPHATAPVTMSEIEEERVWNEIKKGFNYINSESDNNRPQIIIIPELSIPLSKEIHLQNIARKMGAVVIAGLDFYEVRNKVQNKAVVIVPESWPKIPAIGRITKFYFGKTFFSYEEKDYFDKKGKIGMPWPLMYVLDAGDYGRIGVAICSDFFDIERFLIYRGSIHHMIVISYNKDVKSYYFLAEAIARLVYCNVVICNTGFYGGSIVFSLFEKDYKRYIYKHEGGKLFTTQILTLPVESLDAAQTFETDTNKIFKARPPAYKRRY